MIEWVLENLYIGSLVIWEFLLKLLRKFCRFLEVKCDLTLMDLTPKVDLLVNG